MEATFPKQLENIYIYIYILSLILIIIMFELIFFWKVWRCRVPVFHFFVKFLVGRDVRHGGLGGLGLCGLGAQGPRAGLGFRTSG